ncbi:enoyl-CoA hydratase/isomerase family protein [Phenylobacterium sp.]|uniref:enoyl-CoA hydratase/isomerase family protein n=1 Tax=Phenylobacterium sp. TaxID=1871053 RepID=UPI0035B13E7B
MDAVLYGEAGGIARITLNRPDRLNAINTALIGGLRAALSRAIASPAAEVIILQGAGRAFCAGDDLEEFGAGLVDAAGAEAFIADLQTVTRQIMLGPKPVVCAAQGWIVGGGSAWPLNADFALLAEDATLFCPEAAHGLFPTGGMTMLVEAGAGPALARRVLWMGERLGAAQMLAAGLASAVVPRDRLEAEAEALAARLLALPAGSRRRLKAARAADVRDRLECALAFEAAACLEAVFDAETQARVAANWGG